MVDIRDSRKMPEERRQDVQDVIAASVAYLNALFQRDLLCEVVFSAGDEVQGLFSNAAAAYLYYRALSLLVLQADLRGGVGYGTWDVRVEGAPSTAQDGTAYHHARDAIAYAKKSRLYDFALSSGCIRLWQTTRFRCTVVARCARLSSHGRWSCAFRLHCT